MSRFTTLTFTLKKSLRFYKNTELSKSSSTLHVHKTAKIKDESEHCSSAEHSFSVQPVSVSQNLHRKDFLPYIQVKSIFVSLKPLSPVLVTTGHGKKSF